MSAFAAWTLVPAVYVLLVTGWGLLADRLTGSRLPAALLPGVGLGALIAVTGLPVLIPGGGPAAVVLGPLGAVAGLVVGRRRLAGADIDAWAPALLAAAGVLALQALPTLLDHAGVIGGFGRLDDSATWLGLTDRVIEHGRDVGGLPPGTYTRVLKDYLGQGYPVGSLLPVGITARVAFQDVANAYQPVIAGYAVVLCCSLYATVRTLVASRAAAAVVALGAAQASLLYGYAQWGGVKELATAALLATAAPLAVRAWRQDGGGAAALTVVTAGALAGVLGIDGAPWVLPAAALGPAGWIVATRGRPAWRWLVGLVPIGALAALPALLSAELLKTSPTTFGANAVSEAEGLGRLLAPLHLLQGAGVWPQEDFRAPTAHLALHQAIAAMVVALAVGGLVLGIARRAAAVPALLGTVGLGTAAIVAYGSPWIDAKALAVTSPMVLAAAGTALAVALTGALAARAVAAGLAVVLLAALVGSTIAVARSTPAAPRSELTELRDIGRRFAGTGPTLVLAHEVYATRHFLRDLDVEGASERRDRYVYLRSGALAPDYTEVNVQDVAPADLAVYRLVVRRHGAPGRMPAGYVRVHAGPIWEVWRRG